MLYAILCYDSEDVVSAWSKEEDAAVMAKLAVVHQKLAAAGRRWAMRPPAMPISIRASPSASAAFRFARSGGPVQAEVVGIMRGAFEMNVPLEVNVATGDSWAAAKG